MSQQVEDEEIIEVDIEGLTIKQQEIVQWYMDSVSSMILVMGARGAGKSALACIIIGIQSQLFPGRDIIYASQSCDNSTSQWQECIRNDYIRSLLRVESKYGAPFSKQPPTLHFANGCNCVFWSMERSDGKRGRHVPLVIIDESQNIADADYREILSQMADIPGGQGRTLVLGSCPIYGTWYHELSMVGEKWPNKADVKKFVIMPEDSRIFEGPEGQIRLERKRQQIGEAAFRTEYMLETRMPGQSYFLNAHITQCSDGCELPGSDEPTILAYDPATGGKSGDGDPAAMLVMNKDGHILFSKSWPQETEARTKLFQLAEIAKKYHSFVVFDSNGAFSTRDQVLMTLDDLLPFGVTDLPMMKSVKVGYFDDFALALENKEIHIPETCAELIRQTREICTKKSSSGYASIQAPYKSHDDEICCAVLAYQGIKQGYLEKLKSRENTSQYRSLNIY